MIAEEVEIVSARVKINTGFPSAAKTAKKLGVSAKVLEQLSSMAEHSRKTGEFVLPGVGELVRVKKKGRTGRNPLTGEVIRIPAKTVIKFRPAKERRAGRSPATGEAFRIPANSAVKFRVAKADAEAVHGKK